MIDISVVICIKNGAKTIRRTLNSLKQSGVREVIVVDGKSTDDTLDIVKEFNVKIFSDNGLGLGYARQLGAEKSNSNYVSYIDCDTEIPNPEVLTLMLEELINNNWVAIQAQIVDPRDDKSIWEEGESFHWETNYNIPGPREFIGTIVCIIDKKILQKYKFDINIKGAAEDADFYHRLKMQGCLFGISNQIAYHYHRSSFISLIKQRMWYGRGNSVLLIKHHAPNLIFTPFLIMVNGALKSVKNRKYKLIIFYCVWGWALWIGTIIGLLKQSH